MKKISIIIIILIIFGFVGSAYSIDQKEAEKIVIDAISAKKEIDDKVRSLIDLAWYDATQPPEVSEAAKQKLREFARSIIDVMNRAILSAPPSAQKEMIPILIHAYNHRKRRGDLEYANTFSNILRSPEREIKMMAMDALARYNVQKVTIYVIDAIYDDPSLELYGIKTLGLINDPKAAKFLIGKLASPDKTIADTAEEAISRMAWQMPLDLKKGLLDDRFNVRQRCLRLLLPIAKADDLSFLYHISSRNEKFDPELLGTLKETIKKLEEEKEAFELEDAAIDEEAGLDEEAELTEEQ